MERFQVCLQVIYRRRGTSDAGGYDPCRDTGRADRNQLSRGRTTLAESVVPAGTSLVWTSCATHDERGGSKWI